MKVTLPYQKVGSVDVDPPIYQSSHASGLDLRAAIEEKCSLVPGERKLFPTGFAFAIPEGFEGQVRPRSSLSLKGIDVPIGTIDADYRGEIKVVLSNASKDDFIVHKGDRIAQLIIAPVQRASLIQANRLDETARGDGGFGSTGKK